MAQAPDGVAPEAAKAADTAGPTAIVPAGPVAPPQTAIAAPADKAEESQTHLWEFGISIQAAGGPCAGLLGTFPVPLDCPEQDVKVAGEQVSHNVQHRSRQIDGLKQVVFNIPQLAAGSSAECFITFEVTKRAQKPPADTSRLVIPKDPPASIKKFLAPSPLIEATNTKVRGLARECLADSDGAWEQVRGILEAVREKVKYELDIKNEFKGAIGALRDGKADREDLTATFIAVCRAAKIPARMVWAMDFCYAEFYLEETPAVDEAAEGEKPAKPKKTGKDAKAPKGTWYPAIVHQNVGLGACPDFRPVMEKGDNFKVPEEPAVQRFVKEFLKGKGGTGGKPVVEFRRRRAD
jgi:hypothetical protein